MRILGLQNLTLLDYPGKTACTVFTGGCNLRCPFCHNASLVLDKYDTLYTEQQVFDLLEKRRGKISGIAITGGEPLMQPDIADFMAQLHDRGVKVKLDTNGTFPGKLQQLIEAGLVDYVAMDIKNCPARYAQTCGLPESASEGLLANIQKSIDLIRGSGLEHEFRTTVVRELHSPEDIQAMARWMQGDDPYFLQCFTDSGDILQPGLSAWSREEMQKLADLARPWLPKVQLRGL